MPLTQSDLQQIENIVESKIAPLQAYTKTMRDDIKEIKEYQRGLKQKEDCLLNNIDPAEHPVKRREFDKLETKVSKLQGWVIKIIIVLAASGVLTGGSYGAYKIFSQGQAQE